MPKKSLSSEVFYWDAPSRSLHKRDLFPLQVEIEGQVYNVPKWNMDYFKAVNFLHRIDSNEPFKVKLIIRFRDFNIQFETAASQLNYNSEKKELIAHFESIPEEHRELLHYFSDALETGDMVNIDNVLRRVDMPVTPASTQLADVQNKKSFYFKRFLFSTAYVLLGAGLVAFSLSSLQRKLTEIEVTSAFISKPLVSVQSPYQGSIEEVFISEGNTVEIGQPLLTLKSQGVANTATQDLESQRFLIKAELDKKRNNIGSVDIYQRKIEVAKATLSAALSSQQIKCNARYESEIDRRAPLKRNAECNAANDKVTSAKIRLSLEKEQFTIGQQKLSRNRKTVRTLGGKLKKLQLEIKDDKQLFTKDENKKTLKSQVSGHVISVLDDQYQYLTRGQTVALIQPKNSQDFIEAYITQEQALELKVGDKAQVTSATFTKGVSAVIDKIEYTINTFSPSNKERLNWNVPKENSVKLTLIFANKHSATLPLGLPVTLTIKKESNKKGSMWERVTAFFTKKNQTESDDSNIFGVAYADDVSQSVVVPTYCKSKLRLFPKGTIQSLTKNESTKVLFNIDWKKNILQKAEKNRDIKSSAIKTLTSSGITDATDERLKVTRKSLRDAETTSLLSLAFFISNKPAYLEKAKELLLDWAKTYKSNGHPINETRLEGFLWSYDLLRCYFSLDEQEIINKWLKDIQTAKHKWDFGPTSFQNNLQTHQLKMLLMLDRLLDDEASLKSDRETLQIHLVNNLQEDGVSYDYKERNALHYHLYNLEPWLEIALLEPEYKKSVNKAYDFLVKQIKDDNIHNQFVNSKQKIDKKRAAGGFSYAKKGGSFDPKRIARSVIVHSTVNQLAPSDKPENKYLTKKLIKKNIFFIARDNLWKP
jgi:multidrug resistance efflux pump